MYVKVLPTVHPVSHGRTLQFSAGSSRRQALRQRKRQEMCLISNLGPVNCASLILTFVYTVVLFCRGVFLNEQTTTEAFDMNFGNLILTIFNLYEIKWQFSPLLIVVKTCSLAYMTKGMHN